MALRLPAHLTGSAEIPDEVMGQIDRYVELFTTGAGRERFGEWLAKEQVYGPMIRERLRDARLPEQLVYLAMIESGFNTVAVSRAGATGMWQFMTVTAREAGLRVDAWVDERRDPVAATQAAIRYLRWLYAELEDWPLVAAAYNAGIGRVTRARGGDETDYYTLVLHGRLPEETRRYVPLMLAAAYVGENRELFGWSRDSVAPYEPVSVELPGRTKLDAVARAASISPEELAAWNPHLLRKAVPPEGGAVRLPSAVDTAAIRVALAAIPVGERLLPEYAERHYTVVAGDNLSRIAAAHGVSVAQIKRLNGITGDLIRPGQRLLIERRASVSDNPTAPTGDFHTVTSGETLSGLSARLGVPMRELMRWNGMEEPRGLRIGEKVRIRPPGETVHTVERGETMTAIARRYGLTVQELAERNGMDAPPVR